MAQAEKAKLDLFWHLLRRARVLVAGYDRSLLTRTSCDSWPKSKQELEKVSQRGAI